MEGGGGGMGKTTARGKKKRERWLLTRKTWRYMADAGRKLIPDNAKDDVPKIEAYFQEVCHKEPKFLLWRKQSYPGALSLRKRNRKRRTGGSCRDKAHSADEAETPPDRYILQPGPSGRFDLQRMKREFFLGKQQQQQQIPQEEQPSSPQLQQEIFLLDTLQKYLYQDKALDHEQLLQKLKEHLANIEKIKSEERKRAVQFEGDPAEKSLLETIRRYFSKTTTREKVISDMLTDRKKLEKLYFELRQTRGFMAGSRGTLSGRQTWKGTYASQENIDQASSSGQRSPQPGYPLSQGFSLPYGLDRGSYGVGYSEPGPSGYGSGSYGQGNVYAMPGPSGYSLARSRSRYPREDLLEEEYSTPESNTPSSPPPTIEVEPEVITTRGIQTDRLPNKSINLLEEELKRLKISEKDEEGSKSPPKDGQQRRASLIDNDDVSPSVSDTIKRYLRMARKKSVDSDKADRFKRVNYDKNLRNIKAKGEITKISDDDGLDKGCQTDESWVEAFKNLKMEYECVLSSRSSLTEETLSPTSPTSPTSKSFLSSGQSFLSNLLHGLQDKSGVSVGGMQKSKSSTSVVQQGSRLVAQKIWKSRSKSQSRATPAATSTWTPQGNCVWSNVSGREVTLTDTTLIDLSEIERRILHKVALAKLHALNLGLQINLISENPAPVVQKQKRRPYLLKRKAITTAFDAARKEDKEKESGMVFGVPLGQCVENERLKMCLRGELEDHTVLRRKSHHGSRSSFSSLIESPRGQDKTGSCESLMSPTLSMPGLDNLSCGSTQNLGEPTGGTGVPAIITSCLRHLENYGLHMLGIFRVSSSKKRVRQLREEFDCGKEIVLEEDQCPHDVATLLKEYLRDLPDPLLCRSLYHAFIQTQRIRNRRLQQEALQHLIQLLPVAHRDTLWVLLNFLHLVSYYSIDKKNENGEWVSGNKMDSSNLATLFAPNVLHPVAAKTAKEELSAERTEERSDAINVIRTLIDNYKTLFAVSAELLDEVYVHMMDSHPESLDQLLRKRDTSADETEDSITAEEKKLWPREDFIHEGVGVTSTDSSVKSWRMERGRERSSRRRKEEIAKKRAESESSSRRTSGSDDRARVLSSDSGRHTPDEVTSGEGVITASLKIPVPSATSFSLNLDDIPFIEDSEKHHQLHGSESGVGSLSRGGSSSWESGQTSPESEPRLPQLQRVTIHHTSQIQQVQPSYAKTDSYVSPSVFKSTADKLPKSASTSAVTTSALAASTALAAGAAATAMPTEHILPLAKEALASKLERSTGISFIGDRVMRSKTADFERRISAGQSRGVRTCTSGTSLDKDYKRKYTDSRHYTRQLQQHEESPVSVASSSSSQTGETSRGIWKRRELISSEPKERRTYY